MGRINCSSSATHSFPLLGAGASLMRVVISECQLDGHVWTTVTGYGPNGAGQRADAGFPTLGFTDITDPFSSPAGSVPTDFTRPVDPNFNPFGKSLAEVVAGYDGAGGGLGIDMARLGSMRSATCVCRLSCERQIRRTLTAFRMSRQFPRRRARWRCSQFRLHRVVGRESTR